MFIYIGLFNLLVFYLKICHLNKHIQLHKIELLSFSETGNKPDLFDVFVSSYTDRLIRLNIKTRNTYFMDIVAEFALNSLNKSNVAFFLRMQDKYSSE